MFIKGCVPVPSNVKDTAVNKNNGPDLCVDYILGIGHLRKRYHRVIIRKDGKCVVNDVLVIVLKIK